jgi:flagellar protein FliO/FliZ
MTTPYTFIFAFVVVLALIGLAAWLVRRFAGNRLGANANRSRMPRLAVIDAAAVDGRRRLVLVRRDNVEHLLMIGGPTDIVVEPNIVRAAMPGRDQPAPRGAGAELRGLPPTADLGNWPDSEGGHEEPHLPEPPARASRPAFADEPRRPSPPPPMPERRSDPLAGFAPEPMTRPEPRLEPRSEPAMPRAAPRSEPMMPRPPVRPAEPAPRAAPPPPPRMPERAAPPPPPPPQPAPAPAASSADQNLADMAQRLEAALRRPAADARSEPSEPRIGALPVAPEPPPSRAAPRVTVETTRHEPAAAPPVAPPSKTGFENLEDEMASLLGRPKSPT